MTNEGKTPIQVIQELLAVLSTRREACEQLLDTRDADGDMKQEVRDCADQTNRFIDELTAELSLFGDAVTSEVDRENEYLVLWNNSNSDDLRNLRETFQQMETSLVRIYTEAEDTQVELPPTLKDIIQKQAEELKRRS